MKFYKLFVSKYINFLENILTELNRNPVIIEEDLLAPIIMFKNGASKYSFIPIGKERLYFRLACIYLEKQNLVTIIDKSSENPSYVITFEGFVIMDKGGLCRKYVLDYLSAYLQRLFWVLALIAFIFNVYVYFKS